MSEGKIVPAIPVGEVERMAIAVAKSGLFGVKDPTQALALMLVAQAEGSHPATAARDYNIIQGRPALKADAMLARFQQAGGVIEWTEMTDERVAGVFRHPSACPKGVEIDWTIERARQAGFAGKDNWKKFPRQMLRARVISEGIRAVYPGAVQGVYTPEEVADMEPETRRMPDQAEGLRRERPDSTERLAIMTRIAKGVEAHKLHDLMEGTDLSKLSTKELHDFLAYLNKEAKRRRDEGDDTAKVERIKKMFGAEVIEVVADDPAESETKNQQGEDRPDSDSSPAPAVKNPDEPASEKQQKAIYGCAKGAGLTIDDVKAHFGIESVKGLTKGKASEIIDAIKTGKVKPAGDDEEVEVEGEDEPIMF